MRPKLIRFLFCAAIALLTLPATAAPRDKSAQEYIDQAINQHYLAVEFDKAEEVLKKVIEQCDDKCSPEILGKAWMYIGIVRGSGQQDLEGAKEAFKQAVMVDPTVQLDEALATPEVKEAYLEVGGKPGQAPAAQQPTTQPTPGAVPDPVGNMECTPATRQVQTRRPIPVSCVTATTPANVELRYLPAGSSEWSSVTMQKTPGGWRGTIPCAATMDAGPLQMYVTAKDSTGEVLDSYGNKGAPVSFGLALNVAAEPPSFPGQPPPDRCKDPGECPPDFPGCGEQAQCGARDWGEACGTHADCKCGLLCYDDTCETAPTCTSDIECDIGSCIDGRCSVTKAASQAMMGGTTEFKRHRLGLHIAQDFGVVGGDDVCVVSQQDSQGFACYYAGSETPYRPTQLTDENPITGQSGFVGEPFPGAGIQTGIVPATTRALLSYDFALTNHITLGGRLGFAFGGGPPAGKIVESTGEAIVTVEEGEAFMPFHAEGRATYWFRGLENTGFLPYVHAGGGFAQVDANVEIDVVDCAYLLSETGGATAAFNECVGPDEAQGRERRNQLLDRADELEAAGESTQGVNPRVDVWRKMGRGFVTAGGGVVYAFNPMLGLQLNVNAMFLFGTGSTAFVVEPSLGPILAF